MKARARISGTDVVDELTRNTATAVGSAAEEGVVDDDQLLVAAKLDIELDGVCLLVDSFRKGCQSILGPVGRSTTVSDDERLLAVFF